MRLSALSRKIDKTPNQLITFLEKHDIIPENGLHSILDNDTVEMVLKHFLPKSTVEDLYEKSEIEPLIESPSEVSAPIEEVEADKTAIIQEENIDEEIDEEIEPEIVIETKAIVEETIIVEEKPASSLTQQQPKTGTVDDMENEDFAQIELIKAKKVKLEGFKVLGKIDLPEKPKKEPSAESENESEEKATKKPGIKGGKFDRDRKKNKGLKPRSPLSYEERQIREEREKLRQRKKKEKEDKLRKKKIYEANLKAKTEKISKKKKNTKSNVPIQSEQKAVVYKNPVKRLWAWLNGRYDKF